MKEILKLNEISPVANSAFPADYALVKESENPTGIMLRSFNMHEYEIPASVLAIARAGAGVNNIPVADCAEKGIVVFNTPGANANAVKELVLCSLLLASRKIVDGIDWVKSVKDDPTLSKTVEKGKSKFVGPEILGKKLGVIGLGAIGAMVANSAHALGMEVYGYDPYISVDAAWNLSRAIKHETDLVHLLSVCDYVTLHIPYTGENKGMFNTETIAKMKTGAALINLSRGELVDSAAVLEATASGKLSRYVTDFADASLVGAPNVICMPHLGASTPEAEDNCAVMAAQELVDFIDNGNINKSVNYPNCAMPRSSACRVTVCHKNQPNMIAAITAALSKEGLNIENFVDKSKGDFAYSILDLNATPSAKAMEELNAVDGVIRTRVIA